MERKHKPILPEELEKDLDRAVPLRGSDSDIEVPKVRRPRAVPKQLLNSPKKVECDIEDIRDSN